MAGRGRPIWSIGCVISASHCAYSGHSAPRVLFTFGNLQLPLQEGALFVARPSPWCKKVQIGRWRPVSCEISRVTKLVVITPSLMPGWKSTLGMGRFPVSDIGSQISQWESIIALHNSLHNSCIWRNLPSTRNS